MPIISIKRCLNCSGKDRPVSHEWLFDGATLKELRMIKQLTGMRAGEFAEAGDEGDPEATAALLYVLHQRIRITVPFEEIDLDFNDFKMEPTETELAEMKKLEEEMERAAAEAQAPKVKPDEKPAPKSGPRKRAASTPKSPITPLESGNSTE